MLEARGAAAKVGDAPHTEVDCYERPCQAARLPRFLVDLGWDGMLGRRLAEPRLERYIGVVYRTEFASHYAQASLSRQFDAYVWLDESCPLTPLAADRKTADALDPYPFGL